MILYFEMKKIVVFILLFFILFICIKIRLMIFNFVDNLNKVCFIIYCSLNYVSYYINFDI